MNRCVYALLFGMLLLGEGCRSSGSVSIASFFRRGGTANWSTLGADERRSGYVPTELHPPLELAWKFFPSSSVGSVIVVSDSLVYFTSLDGRVYVLNLRTGREIGKLKYYHASTAGAALVHHTMVFGLAAGKPTVVGYHLYDRRYLFLKDLGPVETTPVVFDDYVYLGSDAGVAYALSSSDGEVIWKVETGKPVRSSPAIGGTSVVFGDDNGRIRSVNRFNGKTNWYYDTGQAVAAAPALDETQVYLGSTDSTFYCLSLKDGQVQWKYRVGATRPGNFFATAAVDDERVYVGATDGYLYAFEKTKGHLLWTVKTDGAISTAPAVTRSHVFIGSQDFHMYGLEKKTGEIVWKFRTSGRIKTNPALYGEYLIFASEGRYIYAFKNIL